jgi:hypothetical protein
MVNRIVAARPFRTDPAGWGFTESVAALIVPGGLSQMAP